MISWGETGVDASVAFKCEAFDLTCVGFRFREAGLWEAARPSLGSHLAQDYPATGPTVTSW